MVTRCPWATSPLMIEYHDTEWGRFTLDDRVHFEHLCLEGFQAGLSWETVLKKRENLRRLFAGFDWEKAAVFDEKTIARILEDAGGIRNRAKVRSVVNNAVRFVELHRDGGAFSALLLALLGGKPIVHEYREISQIPAFTGEAADVSKALKKLGYSFVGPTIVYAHLQATGLVNDHLVNCFVRNDPMLREPPEYGG
jgi:DNA-3-methyladenine glycosylase I